MDAPFVFHNGEGCLSESGPVDTYYIAAMFLILMNKQYSYIDKIKHRTEGGEKYPVWSELASLQLVN